MENSFVQGFKAVIAVLCGAVAAYVG